MTTSPAPQVTRGDLTLQPSYFTSSLFVYPLREDITNLTQIYSTKYAQSDRAQPFALFKGIWNEQGWTWLHLRVFDARAREKFLEVVFRLFIGANNTIITLHACKLTRTVTERLVSTSHPIEKVVAIFGIYTFYFSQPSTSGPSLYSLKHIPIPIGMFYVMPARINI